MLAEDSDRCFSMIRAGQGLCDVIDVLDSSPRKMERFQVQRLYDSVKAMLAGWTAADIEFKPKMHLLFHLVERARTHGNPRFYGTFLDESLNCTLRDIARSAHRLTWEARIFSRFGWAEERRVKKQKLPKKGGSVSSMGFEKRKRTTKTAHTARQDYNKK